MKKGLIRILNISFVAILFFLILYSFKTTPIFAGEYPSNQSEYETYLKDTNQQVYSDDLAFKSYYSMYDKYDMIFYGKPEDIPGNDPISSSDHKCGREYETRFLGYDKNNDEILNPCFRDDSGSGDYDFSSWNYNSSPYYVANSWDKVNGYSQIESYIKQAPLLENDGVTSAGITLQEATGGNYYSYARLETIPTVTSPGSVTLWHDGNWYYTFNIPSLERGNDVLNGYFASIPDQTIDSLSQEISVNYSLTTKLNFSSGYMDKNYISKILAGYYGEIQFKDKNGDTGTITLSENNEQVGKDTYSITANGSIKLPRAQFPAKKKKQPQKLNYHLIK